MDLKTVKIQMIKTLMGASALGLTFGLSACGPKGFDSEARSVVRSPLSEKEGVLVDSSSKKQTDSSLELQEPLPPPPSGFDGNRTVKLGANKASATTTPQTKNSPEGMTSKGKVRAPKKAQPGLKKPSVSEPVKFELVGGEFSFNEQINKMKFIGQMKKNGKFLENIELEGNFDSSRDVWMSNDLFPVDQKVRGEKRIQAVAICLGRSQDPNERCREVAVDFFYKYKDEILKLHFEKKTKAFSENSQAKYEEDYDHEDTELGDQTYFDGVEYRPMEPEEYGDEVSLSPPGTPDDGGGDDEPNPEGEEAPTEGDSAQPETQNGLDRSLFIDEEYENSTLLSSGVTQTPAPKMDSDSAIKGIEKFATETFRKAIPQAFKRYNRGYLRNASSFPLDAPGITRRDRKANHPVYGADLMIAAVLNAAEATNAKFSGRPPFSVGHLSAKNGGKLGGHASHQNGLDVDLAFPHKTSRSRSFWSAWNGKSFSQSMDKERMWHFSKELVCTKYNGKFPVNSIFIDRNIKKQMCLYAKSIGENLTSESSCAVRVLRSYYHVKNHHHHFHVRFNCPGTEGCTSVPLPRQPLGC